MNPNIIYINSHDTGRYIQPYGYRVDTPHLQRLAEEGVLFRRAFSAAPTCSPSRAALVLGQLPHRTGMMGLGHRGFLPRDHTQHLAHTLQAAGYVTAVDSRMPSNHLGVVRSEGALRAAEQCGYMRKLQVEHDADNTSAIAFIREAHDRPFFLSISYSMTHRKGRGFNTEPNPADDPRYLKVPAPLPDHPVARADWAHYCSDVRELDRAMGEIFGAVDEAGLRENTLIIATTDHGPAFPGMKCGMTVQGTGVFLIMRGPGGFSGGKVVDSLVSHLEIYPTVCELAGIERPSFLEGASLFPLVRGEVSAVRTTLLSEVTYHAAYEPKRAIRDERWVYVRRFGSRTRPVVVNCDASPTRDLWLEDGVARHEEAEESLYDSFYDSDEMGSLAPDPRYQEALSRMRGLLDAAMRETGDPLLDGDVALPLGAWSNDPDDLFPNPAPARK